MSATGAKRALVRNTASVYELATAADRGGARPRRPRSHSAGLGETVDLTRAAFELPVSHPDPAHLHLTGTGLTHLGSASARDAMHAKLAGAETLTDSMKMFRMGLEGGRPDAGEVGAQPEWFYKGNGHAAVAPGAALEAPGFAEDGGEEPEIAGIYLIGPDGTPHRIGWALGNEFSDHVTERVNYLWLAHSKLRVASFGPEILVGDLPADIRGTSASSCAAARCSGKSRSCRARRTCRTPLPTWSITTSSTTSSASPATCMCTTSAPPPCPLPTGSRPKPATSFEIEVADFGLPLRNTLAFAPKTKGATHVRPL